MPVKSKAMWKLIQAKRSKYKTKAKTPKKEKWIWEKDWFDGVDYKSLPNKKVHESIESIQDYENQFGIVKKSFEPNIKLSLLKDKEDELEKGNLIRTVDVPSITVGLGEDECDTTEKSKKFSFKEEAKKLISKMEK